MTESVTLTVTGMKCGGCEANVSARLKTLDGVTVVTASSKDKTVYVEFDPQTTGIADIKTAITQAGFTAE